jgi:hypothetical protein
VDVVLDGRTLGSVAANDERQDLREAGIGDGRHGFAFPLPAATGSEEELIEARAGRARVPLRTAHRWVTPAERRVRPVRYSAAPEDPPAPPEGALLGLDGWLFSGYQARRVAVSPERVQAAALRYEDVCRSLSELSIRYVLVIVPEKQDVYPEFAARARSPHAECVHALLAELRDSVWPEPFDLADALRDGRTHGVLYPRTDSGWNARGGFLAARAVVKEVAKRVPAAVPLALERGRGVAVEEFCGDLVQLPRFGLDRQPIDRTPVSEVTIEDDASTLRSVQMPAPERLSAPGHPAPRLFTVDAAPQLPRLALMGGAAVERIMTWFAEHSRRTLVIAGHEPRLELLELEAPDAVVHVVTALELLTSAAELPG